MQKTVVLIKKGMWTERGAGRPPREADVRRHVGKMAPTHQGRVVAGPILPPLLRPRLLACKTV